MSDKCGTVLEVNVGNALCCALPAGESPARSCPARDAEGCLDAGWLTGRGEWREGNTMELCNRDCNNCPIVNHPNSRMLTKVLNALFDEFGDGAYDIVQENCPNLTVCYDCRIDDFCHVEGCEIWSDDDMTPNSGNGAVRFCVSGCFGVQRTPPRQRQFAKAVNRLE